jgi:phosphoribosylanthranilate isomerase
VGVYVNEDIETVYEDVEDMDLQYVQLHGEETPAYCAKVKKVAKVIKAFGIDAKFDFEKLKKYEKDVNWFLFDTKTSDYGGSGQKFDWKLLKKYKLKKPVIISGGISLDDAIQIKKLPYKFVKAVDLNSKFEEEPGIKDVDMVYTFMEYLKA